MKKTVIYTIFLASLISCSNQTRKIEVIVYSKPPNPVEVYSQLTNELLENKMIDSLYVIGLPISIPVMNYKFDTNSIESFGLSIAEINELMAKYFQKDSLVNIKKNKDPFIPIDDKFFISLEDIALISVTTEYFKPEIFKVEPQQFNYHGREAVKLEIYYNERSKKKIIKFINITLQKFSANNTFAPYLWEYEII